MANPLNWAVSGRPKRWVGLLRGLFTLPLTTPRLQNYGAEGTKQENLLIAMRLVSGRGSGGCDARLVRVQA